MAHAVCPNGCHWMVKGYQNGQTHVDINKDTREGARAHTHKCHTHTHNTLRNFIDFESFLSSALRWTHFECAYERCGAQQTLRRRARAFSKNLCRECSLAMAQEASSRTCQHFALSIAFHSSMFFIAYSVLQLLQSNTRDSRMRMQKR